MKKLLLLLFALTLVSSAKSQVLFYESFDSIAGDNTQGPGTWTFPNGWLLANVDNQTPNSSVSYVTDAWIRREDFANNVNDTAALSTSWYATAGTSDDWMVTPAIGPLPANVVLSWRAIAYDPAYPDGYEVRIMTTAPTGSAGNIGNLVTASTVVFSVANEVSTWTNHTIQLGAYAGQSVYVAFRNNSTDDFLLLIDDVKLEVSAADDAKLVSVDSSSEYTIIPKSQVHTVPTYGTVLNNGSNALTNVALKLNVYDGTNTMIYTNTGSAVASLASAASVQLNAGGYSLPAIPDFYTFEYVVTHTGVDNNTANDTLYDGILVDDSTFARDNGTVVGSLGIGAGNGGYIGQQFTLTAPASLTSISFYVTRGYTGTNAACALWDMASGAPNAIIAGTDTITYPDDSARYYTLPIHGGPYTLQPGTYTVTGIEFDSTLALAQCSGVFTAGTGWVNWPTSPTGTWANPESFGANFAKTSLLRLNLNPDCSNFTLSTTTVNATCNTCATGSATAVTSGAGPFTYLWSNGATTASITNVVPGNYTVTVSSGGCSTFAGANVSFNVGISENEMASATTIYPNPGKGVFTVVIPQNFGVQSTLQVTNELGQVVYTQTELTVGTKDIDLSKIASGKYVVKISSDKYNVSKNLTIIK